MTLNTCITESTDNYVIVTEITDGEQYLPEGSSLTAKNRFVYEDTASIDLFRLNATTGDTYTPATIVDRSNPEDAKVKLDRDGWFTSIHIVIPTQQWVYRELSKSGSIINTYDVVYFTDGDEIFTCIQKKIERTTLQALLDEDSTNTTISRVDGDYVSINLLQEKLNSLYTELFENRLYNGGCGTNACEANRLVTALNLIRHYVRWGQLAEAERIIEKINDFDGATKVKEQIDKRIFHDCGCL